MAAPNSRVDRRSIVAFTALLLLVGIAATWPIFSDPAELAAASIGNNDYWFNVWVVHWGAHALTSNPLELHQANIFWPERHTFAYSEMEIGHSLLIAPAILLGAGPVLVINLLTLLSMVIGGTGAFVLGARVTGSRWAGAVAGLVFVFNDAHFARRLQIQFFGDYWLPWMALATILWLDKRTLPRALAAGALFVLHAATGSHNAVFGALVVAVITAVHFLRARLWNDPAFWRSLATFTLLPVLLLAPLFYPYLLVQERMADERGANPQALAEGSARPIDLATGASRLHRWVDDRLGWPSDWLPGPLGSHLFPGWIPLLLAALAIGARRRPDSSSPAPDDHLVWWLLAGLCGWLALGPAAGLYVPLAQIPGLNLIRVPSRFLLPGLLGLAMLAAIGAARLIRRPRGAWLVATVLVLFAAESTHAPVESTPLDLSPDPATRWIASRPGDFAILELPADPDNLSAQARQTLFSIHHFKKLLGGYSGWRSPEVTRRLRRIDRRFPARGLLDELLELDVRYVIARESRLPPRTLRRIERERRLEEVFRDDTVSIWEILPRP